MSSDNRTPRLHSFRIACAIASATLCATAIAQVAFSLKPAIEVLDNPVIADSPAYPALAISTLVPAVIGIATTILSAVLVWTIKSGDPFKKGSATCLKVLGILFVRGNLSLGHDLVEANNYGHGVSLRNLVGVEVQLSGVQEELGKHEQDDAENQRGPIE